jgi:hypothetical protein
VVRAEQRRQGVGRRVLVGERAGGELYGGGDDRVEVVADPGAGRAGRPLAVAVVVGDPLTAPTDVNGRATARRIDVYFTEVARGCSLRTAAHGVVSWRVSRKG